MAPYPRFTTDKQLLHDKVSQWTNVADDFIQALLSEHSLLKVQLSVYSITQKSSVTCHTH